MSTRAVYSFFGDDETPRHVYKHSDGYPSGAVKAITDALEYAWPLPRYENDEFAAAFVAANKSHFHNRLLALYRKAKKTKEDKEALQYYEDRLSDAGSGGQVRLIVQSEPMLPAMSAAAAYAGDLEYRYEIRCIDGTLYVKAFATDFWRHPKETEIFSGTLAEMHAWATKKEDAE